MNKTATIIEPSSHVTGITENGEHIAYELNEQAYGSPIVHCQNECHYGSAALETENYIQQIIELNRDNHYKTDRSNSLWY